MNPGDEGTEALAREIADLVESLGPLLQPHTSALCPQCPDVCCKDRHSAYDRHDLVCFTALRETPPDRRAGIDGDAPCQFLRQDGCMLPRSLRPYRCTWYFCPPLLSRMSEQDSPAAYRRLINVLEAITRKRLELIERRGAGKGPLDGSRTSRDQDGRA